MGGTLARTIYHAGRKYLAGTTSEEIGAVAAEFGDHVWEGGRKPDDLPTPEDIEQGPAGGVLAGSPPVPSPTALPSPAGAQTLAGAAGAPAPVVDGGTDDPAKKAPPAKKAAPPAK